MTLSLIEPVNGLLEKVRELTGKDTKFIERNDLTTHATLKLARRNMPSHLIFYKAEHDESINHLIAHECGHALRMFAVPEDKRLIPTTNDQLKRNALAEIEPEIQSLSSVLPFDGLVEIENLWYNGIIRQLTNLPPDIMIEKWLYDEYAELRPYQSQSIRKQHKEALAALSTEVAKMTPPKILDASNIMNYAFFKILGVHLGVNYVGAYRRSPYLSSGEELVSMTEDYADNYEGDTEMINRWAQFLNLSKWFSWTDFENVPADYQDML